jgi:hypothetical protein
MKIYLFAVDKSTNIYRYKMSVPHCLYTGRFSENLNDCSDMKDFWYDSEIFQDPNFLMQSLNVCFQDCEELEYLKSDFEFDMYVRSSSPLPYRTNNSATDTCK